jgi:hypothetical protein
MIYRRHTHTHTRIHTCDTRTRHATRHTHARRATRDDTKHTAQQRAHFFTSCGANHTHMYTTCYAYAYASHTARCAHTAPARHIRIILDARARARTCGCTQHAHKQRGTHTHIASAPWRDRGALRVCVSVRRGGSGWVEEQARGPRARARGAHVGAGAGASGHLGDGFAPSHIHATLVIDWEARRLAPTSNLCGSVLTRRRPGCAPTPHQLWNETRSGGCALPVASIVHHARAAPPCRPATSMMQPSVLRPTCILGIISKTSAAQPLPEVLLHSCKFRSGAGDCDARRHPLAHHAATGPQVARGKHLAPIRKHCGTTKLPTGLLHIGVK